ncbi:MAG: hypothetical protein JKX73_00405 [Flavobacteriales bacterium]|nr:hypothetical protein [Flavobacteriales bacterium]
MKIYRSIKILFLSVLVMCHSAYSQPKTPSKITFEIKADKELSTAIPSAGRLILILGRVAEPEPRLRVSWPGEDITIFGKDIRNWDGANPILIDDGAIGFPSNTVSEIESGEYYVQALYDTDTTFCHINAPGNFYSTTKQISISETGEQSFTIALNKQIAPEKLPQNTSLTKYVKIQSKLLTKFWGKPMYLRAGIVLPRGYDPKSNIKYPVMYYIGGYHTRFNIPEKIMNEGHRFYKHVMSDKVPQMIVVFLDGEAPYGDSYQINSANNGPYGDATVEELIPYIENEFNAVGTPKSRFLTGGSTGGWVSLALQIFYPDFFNGAWSSCADPVDFSALLLINIYKDKSNFVNEHGYDSPWWRDTDGDIRFTIRDAVKFENVLGRNDTYSLSGMQWGCFNAVCSPKGKNGYPMELFDPMTGEIDSIVANHWKAYDLRLYLAENWERIGPKIQGKIHVKMGDRDSFYLDNAMRLMEAFLGKTNNPNSDAEFVFAPGKGHCWGYTRAELFEEVHREFTSGD